MTPEYTGLAWHFLAGADVPVLRDGRPLVVGEWLERLGQPEDLQRLICQRGLHASTHALNALRYVQGPWVSLVEIEGDEQWDWWFPDEKLTARRRRALWCYDATDELRRFARTCALEVVNLWNPSQVILDYLEGSNNSITTVSQVAEFAARAIARATFWDVVLRAGVMDTVMADQNAMLESLLIHGAIERGLW